MVIWYLVALLCGLLPLLSGIAVFVTWLHTRSHWLMGAGLQVIGYGMVLFMLGLYCLYQYGKLAAARGQISRHRLGWQKFFAGFVLFVNFPVAAAFAVAALDIESRYYITVINEAPLPMEECVVSGGGVWIDLGRVEPGAIQRRSFHIQTDGELTCCGIYAGRRREALVEGYVTNGEGGEKIIRIAPDGTVTVLDPRKE